MNHYKNSLLLVFIFLAIVGCKDKWEEHNEVGDPILRGNLAQQIKGNPELSEFYTYLEKTGYDKILSASKSYTVWAPTNTALQNLDQEIVRDQDKLKLLVANHISLQQYFTHSELPDTTSRIVTLNGKYITWDKLKGKVDNAHIVEADGYAKNGAFHIIDAPLQPMMNSWEFLTGTEISPKQSAFMESLTHDIFVDSLSTQIGVDPVTGRPVYDSLQGTIQVNRFLLEAYDLSNEDSLYTFIMLTDAAYEEAYDKLEAYYTTSTPDSTVQATLWAVTKDLAFKGAYMPEELPEVLVSRFGVKVQINPQHIERVEKTSNGVVYVLNHLDIKLEDKLLPIIVEGESIYYIRNAVISHPDKAGSISIRARRNDQGEIFTDLLAYNHDISGFHIRYRVPDVYAATYKVYMTTFNDFNTGIIYQQKLAFGSPEATELPYVDVNLYYQKTLLGEYTVDQYGDVDIYLVGAASTADTANPLNLDYIEMVPVL